MKKTLINKNIFKHIIAIVLVFATIIGSSSPLTVYAASSEELQAQINNIESKQNSLRNRVADLERQKEENVSDIKDMVAQKNILDEQASALSEEVKLVDEKIKKQSELIANKQDELDIANEKLFNLQEKSKERIRAMEANSEVSYWSVIFKANSFTDLLDRFHMISEIAESDRRRLKELSEAAKEVSLAKDALMEEKAEMDRQKKELDALEKEMIEKQEEAAEILVELVNMGEEFEMYMHEAENQLLALEVSLANTKKAYDEAKRQEYLEYLEKLREEEKKKEEENKKQESDKKDEDDKKNDEDKKDESNKSDKDENVKEEADKNKEDNKSENNSSDDKKEEEEGADFEEVIRNESWVSPCSYVALTSPFGYRTHPIYGDRRMHNGVDLASWCPTPIVAARSGVVTIASYNGSAGNYVQIDHLDGYTSIYMHLCKSPDVKVGDVVVAGQKIGCMGTTGASTGVHLHFGIAYNGSYVDPMQFI